jgi:hypothetical protein
MYIGEPPSFILRAQFAFYDQKADTGFAACDIRYKKPKRSRLGHRRQRFLAPPTRSPSKTTSPPSSSQTGIRRSSRATSATSFPPAPLYHRPSYHSPAPPSPPTADTLLYDTLAQKLFLLNHAWLYSYPYQLFARQIHLTLPQQTPDSLIAAGNVFTTSEIDTLLRFYNQVRSDSLLAQWDSTLQAFSPIHYRHNLQAVYYQSDGPHYQGAHEILKAYSLHITLGPNRQPIYLRLEKQPQGRFIPVKFLLKSPLFLPAFQWRPRPYQPQWPIQP